MNMGCCNGGYHEFNLDWFLHEFKKLMKEWDGTREYLENWLKNQDIPGEVKKQIRELINDGTFADLINNELLAALLSKDQDYQGELTNNYVVNDMIEVALTYLANTNSLIYGNNTALNDTMGESEGKKEIDCSTLCCLVLNGVPYEKSRYALGGDKYNNKPDRVWSQNLYDTGAQQFKRYANMLGKTFYDMGHMFRTNKTFSNIRPGDILFWIGAEVPGSFRNISHCAIFLNITATNKIRVIESNVDGAAVRIGSYNITDTAYNTIAYAGRPEFNGIDYSYYKNIVIGNQTKILTATETIYYSLESIGTGFYTVLMKGSGNARPTVTIGDASITSYYIGNGLYIAYLRVNAPDNQIKVKISENYNFTLNWIAAMKRFIAYPAPFYIAPKVNGVYAKADASATATGTFMLMSLDNFKGSNYQNAFHLANDNTITVEEGGKYLVSLICNIESKATARIVTYAKGSGNPAPINEVSKSATSAPDSLSLATFVNLNAGDRVGLQVKGTGSATGTLMVMRI